MGNLAPGNGTNLSSQAVITAAAEANNGLISGVGTCLAWVRETFGFTTDPVRGNPPTAALAWQQIPSGGQNYDDNPPAGVAVYWTGGSSGDGHVAISAGGGNLYSTDFGPSGYIGDGRVHATTIDVIDRDSSLTYAGWSPYIGPALIPGATMAASTSSSSTSSAATSAQAGAAGGLSLDLISDAFSNFAKLSLRIGYGLAGAVLVLFSLFVVGRESIG